MVNVARSRKPQWIRRASGSLNILISYSRHSISSLCKCVAFCSLLWTWKWRREVQFLMQDRYGYFFSSVLQLVFQHSWWILGLKGSCESSKLMTFMPMMMYETLWPQVHMIFRAGLHGCLIKLIFRAHHSGYANYQCLVHTFQVAFYIFF